MLVRFLFGMGEAGCFPNIARAFNRWLPPYERVRAQSILWMSAALGRRDHAAAARPAVAAAVRAPRHPRPGSLATWRVAFMLFGLLGVFWCLAFYGWFRDGRPITRRSTRPSSR